VRAAGCSSQPLRCPRWPTQPLPACSPSAGVFGPQQFWVTEMRLIEEQDKMGILVRGNLREDRDKMFQ
jgi:hypothetical protein